MTFNAPVATDVAESNDTRETAEALPPLTSVRLPIALIDAALEVAARGDVRFYLNTVRVHAVGGQLRVVATDGHRMLVLSHGTDAEDGALPEWTAEGVLIDREALRETVALLRRNSLGGFCTVAYGTGHKQVEVGSDNGFATFRVNAVEGKFPDYERVLGGAGVSLSHTDAVPLEAASIAVAYFKSVSTVAQKLGASAVSAFTSSRENAGVFLFEGAPHAVLIVMPKRIENGKPTVGDSAVRILAPAMAATVRALKAHVSRQVKLLNVANSEKQREEIEARKASLEARIAEVMGLTDSTPKLANAAA